MLRKRAMPAQAPLLSNRISVIHGSRINYETICCPQFCTYSYQILCHDTKFGNSRCEIIGRRVIFIWSLIHGLRWSGLIKAEPGTTLVVNALTVLHKLPYLYHFSVSSSDPVTITFGGWNIDGLYKRENKSRINTLDEEDIMNIILGTDVVMLVENHCNNNDHFSLPGYSVHNQIRPKSPGARKHFGGISVVIKESIRPGITFFPSSN